MKNIVKVIAAALVVSVLGFGPAEAADAGVRAGSVTVCTDNGCVKASDPVSKRVKREARRLNRNHAAGWTYVGRTSRPLASDETLHVVKSRVRCGTWHVFKIRRTTIDPVGEVVPIR